MSFTTSQQNTATLNPHELVLRMWDDKQQLLGGHPPDKNRWDPPDKNHLYTTYILLSGGLYATYHLLREPGNSVDIAMENRPL